MSETKGWIGVDLDGTLAHYDRWRGETHIGAPIEKMVGHVKTWLKHGNYDVKVFTARVSSRDDQERAAVEKAIHAWCEEHIGQRLEVVCAKDYAMVALFDDRATQVRPNTGITLAEECEELTQQLAAARAQVAEVEAACFAVCRDNTAKALGEPDPDMARFVCMNEDGDPIIEADTPADVVRQMDECWRKMSERYEKVAAELAAVRKVEEWITLDDTLDSAITAHDGRLLAQSSGIVRASGATFSALGRALAAQEGA